MIFSATLCLLLTLSSTLANQDQVEELMNRISSAVAGEMAKAAKAGEGTNISPLEFNNNVLRAEASTLIKMEPQLQELGRLSDGSPDLAKNLALKIQQSPLLKNVLGGSGEGKKSPRFVGALLLGLTQIATDVTKMALTRY